MQNTRSDHGRNATFDTLVRDHSHQRPLWETRTGGRCGRLAPEAAVGEELGAAQSIESGLAEAWPQSRSTASTEA